MSKLILSKLPKEGGNGWFFIQTEWYDNSFCMTMLDDGVMWSGEINPKEVINLSKQVDLSVHDYMAETRKALATDNGADEYSYSFQDDRFVWKKLCGSIKVKFGFVHLTKTPGYEFFNNFVGSLFDEIHNLRDQISSLHTDKENLIRDNDQLVKKLDQFTTAKTHEIEILYGKFIAILNAKKERIYHLETAGIGDRSPELQEMGVDVPDVKFPRRKQSQRKRKSVDPKRKWIKPTQRYNQGLKRSGGGLLEDIDSSFEDSDSDTEDDPPVVSNSKHLETNQMCKRKSPTNLFPIKSSNTTSEDDLDSDTDMEGNIAIKEYNTGVIKDDCTILPKRRCSNKLASQPVSHSDNKDSNHYDSDTEFDENSDDGTETNQNSIILPKRVTSNKSNKQSEIASMSIAPTVAVSSTQLSDFPLFDDGE